MLLHGLTATRRYVVHGSRVLPRRGLSRRSPTTPAATASPDPAPAGDGYGYDGARRRPRRGDRRARRGERPLRARRPLDGRPHAHGPGARRTRPDRRRWWSIGPVYMRHPGDRGERSPTGTALADGLERGGVEGFVAAYDHGLDPDWRETLLRITRDRLRLPPPPRGGRRRRCARCRARARSSDLAELEFLDLPALVVASHDEADPGHPYAVAEAWAERLPRATLVSEERASRRSPGRAAGSRARSPPSASAPRSPSASPADGSARGGREPVDEPQARPGLVDRADLVVDQPAASASSRTTSSVRSVAPRGALRPGDPEPAVGEDRPRERPSRRSSWRGG